MIYPIIVISLVFVVTFGLLTFVVPKIAETFTQSGQELPGLTLFVMKLSNFHNRQLVFDYLFCFWCGFWLDMDL